jgi:hypoxanthine phosphoribosyltransferase
MHVLTLNNHDFNNHCHRLESLISNFEPDLLVTIATGGDFVGANMFCNVTHLSLRCQRSGSTAKRKSSLFSFIVKHLPQRVNNVLRIIESKILSSRKPRLADIRLTEHQHRVITNAKRILVVDDAVDSGATLIAVLDAIYKVAGNQTVRSAAITVTTEKPLVMPDYFIYNDKTLIRFPWSADAN